MNTSKSRALGILALAATLAPHAPVKPKRQRRRVKARPILFSGTMVRAILDGSKTQTRRVIKPQPPTDNGTGRWSLCVSSTDRSSVDTWGFSEVHPDGNSYTDRGRERQLWQGRCPYGARGDRLWVRETWYDDCSLRDTPPISPDGFLHYRADGEACDQFEDIGVPDDFRWRPSIHMPRWASRITLEVLSVRVERLQDISEEDAKAEGVTSSEVDWFSVLREDGSHYETGGEPTLGVNGVRDYVRTKCPFAKTAREKFICLWDSINAKRGFALESNPWVWVVEFKRVVQ